MQARALERVIRQSWIVAGLCTLVGACANDRIVGAQDPPAAAYIDVIDQLARPLRPDTVYWYYAAEAGQAYSDRPASCINTACTRWAVPVEANGAVYVAAFWQRPTPWDSYCFYLGYDAAPITASADSPPSVTLQLNTTQEACY